MNRKLKKEWFLETPWGKVAMISWGQPHNPPILLIHGYMDSAATFIPLVDLLPDTYHYVSCDFPGHGKSDPVFSGPLVTQSLMCETVRLVVEHMQWKTFVLIAHSMGFVTGLVYQHLYPGQVTKMINLDSMRALAQYWCFTYKFEYYYIMFFYYQYYEDFEKYLRSTPPKLYTYEQAIQAVMRSRSLTSEQAEIVLSRSLVPAENDMYRLTTMPVMRKFVQYPFHEDIFRLLIHSPTPPMLNLNASETHMPKEESDFFSKLDFKSKHTNITVTGRHDVHITNPEYLVPHIMEFLNRNEREKAKL